MASRRTAMDGAEGEKERFGPMLRIGALVATLLALAAVIGPRLAFTGGGEAENAAAASLPAEGVPAANPSGPSGAAAVTTTAAPATTTTTTTTAPATTTTTSTTLAPTTTTAPQTTLPTFPEIVVPVNLPIDGGAVNLTLAGVHADRNGPATLLFTVGDTIWWHLRVANHGEEFLWGVFVYLESYGPVPCSAHRLDVGASTDCWAQTTAVEGTNEAQAWVTAWTAVRMVTDPLSQRVVATAG